MPAAAVRLKFRTRGQRLRARRWSAARALALLSGELMDSTATWNLALVAFSGGSTRTCRGCRSRRGSVSLAVSLLVLLDDLVRLPQR
jgi:hypothetical protein